MFRSVLILSLILFAASARTTTENLESYTFEQFLEEYEKSYIFGSDEYANREKIFYNNVKFIADHNALDDGLVLGVNEFADLTTPEMNKYKGLVKTSREEESTRFLEQEEYSAEGLPDKLDWRDKSGVVSAVKNQKSCGGCWAFSAVESMESAIAIKTGQDAPTLSPQEIIDCSPNPHHCGGKGGCEGSIPELAFKYAKSKGMTSDSNYPYKAKDGTCSISGKSIVGHISGYKDIKSNDRNALLQALQNQPVSVSVAASSPYWHFYFKGIMKHCELNCTIDHAVQAVGYDMTDVNNAYWIVRNSWAHRWGMGGYIYIKMYPDEPATSSHCGTDSYPKQGAGCDGSPATVKVCGQCGILYANSYPVV